MSLSALSPFGPIFGKELRTTSRRKRTYLLRFLYLATLLLILWGIYLDANPSRYDDLSGYNGGVARRAQRAAELGHAFFVGFASFCVISMALISPILTATAVNSERQAKTLPVLLMTPITSWQIISGKLFSRLLAAFTLIGLSLPVLAVVRLLGGVDLDRMLQVVSLCVVTSLFTASIGLFYSTFMNRAYSVILLSYATLLFLYLFVPFLIGMAVQPRGNSGWFFNFLAAINPFAIAIGIAVFERPFRGMSVWPTIITHLVGTGLLVMWSGALLRRLARKQGEGEGGAMPADVPLARVPAPLLELPPLPDGTVPPRPAAPPISPGGPSQRPARTISDNPVLWREVRRPLTSRRWQAVTASVVSIGMLLATYAAVGSSSRRGLADPEFQIGYACVFCGLITLLTCVISATAIAGEKESDTWTILLGTPMPARQIVLGKMAGQFRRMLWPAVVVVCHFALFTCSGVIPFVTFVGILWTTVTFNVIFVASGLYFSLRVRKVTLAVILNLLTPIAAYLLVPFLLMIVGNLFDDRHLPEWSLFYTPYPYLGGVIEGFTERSYFWLPVTHSTDAGTFLMAMFGTGAALLVLAGGLVAYTIRRFDRIVGRAIQRNPITDGEAGGRRAAFLPRG